MIGDYVWADPTQVTTVMEESEGGAHYDSSTFPQDLKDNIDVNAYVETHQIIVVKPPWIDGVANGGRS
ncbi:unnamed protein product [Hymenolepis diminuta]|uniref:Phage related protein n=1 Tax=Hymenolepis diminuta TaxID=6216 RepID=A0A0R3SZ23_HYMDI|nr:unnamed protein product [Hymenolepis diminuta]